MAEKISGYTADGTSNPIKGEDLLDFSNEDGGGGFDVSKKITMDEMMSYVNANVNSYYNFSGALTSGREVTANTFQTRWRGGSLAVQMNDLINDYGYLLNDSSGVEKGRLAFDQANLCGMLELSDSVGVYFSVNNGEARAPKLSSNYTGAMGNYSVITKALNTGTTNFVRFDAGQLSGKFEFGTAIDNPNLGMFDKNGTQQVNLDSGTSSCWFMRPVGVNMTGGTARLSVKANGVATGRVSRVRNSGDTVDLWHSLENGVMGLPAFTVATLPAVALIDGATGIIIVTDETGGQTMATSNGVNWLRVSDGAIVS